MVKRVEYRQGASLPDLAISWLSVEQVLIDFSTGYTFELKVGKPGKIALVSKTSGFTGYAGDPNVVVEWSANELDTLPGGIYQAELVATRTSDSKKRVLPFTLEMKVGVL